MPKRLRWVFATGCLALGAFAFWLGLSEVPGTVRVWLYLANAVIGFTWAAIWIGVLVTEWRAAAIPLPDSPEADYHDPPA
jgi:hypothetical protein